MRRRRSLAIVLLSAGVAAACSTVSNEPEEDTASQAQAVWNRDPSGGVVISNDTNDPVRNVVVQIPHFLADGTEDRGDSGCTGVLITGSLVLTAKYCVSQTKGGALPLVQIGASRGAFTTRQAVPTTFVIPDTMVNGLDKGDIALVYLPRINAPLTGGVQSSHTDLPPGLPAWFGSPTSLVAPTLLPTPRRTVSVMFAREAKSLASGNGSTVTCNVATSLFTAPKGVPTATA